MNQSSEMNGVAFTRRHSQDNRALFFFNRFAKWFQHILPLATRNP
jgi:hypothetical protein